MAESPAMFNDAAALYRQERSESGLVRTILQKVGFADWQKAHDRLTSLCSNKGCREALSDSLPMLFVSPRPSKASAAAISRCPVDSRFGSDSIRWIGSVPSGI